MDIVVSSTPDGWAARHGEVAVGKAAALLRPDGRCFVVFGACHADAYRPLVQAIARQLRRDLYTEIGEADTELLQGLVGSGLVVNRRKHTSTIPTDPASTGLTGVAIPAGFEIVTADRVPEDRLRELDDELKQDVPGADGWRWDRRGFRVVAAVDVTNTSSNRLLTSLGARRTGGAIELVRPWPAASPA